MTSKSIREAIGSTEELDGIWQGSDRRVRKWKKKLQAEKVTKPSKEQEESHKEVTKVIGELRKTSAELKYEIFIIHVSFP